MSKRIYGLDILRAIAILLVVYSHSVHFFGLSVYSYFYLGDGVGIFFVLSGYLIGQILFKTISKGFEFKQLMNFWVRRWLRTIPAYFFVLTALILYTHELHVSYYTFTQNLFNGDLSFYSESWSLCVEEWFYILIPLLFFLFLKLNKKVDFLFAIIGIIVLVTTYRIIKTSSSMTIIEWDNLIRKSVITRLDSIMYGVFAAYVHFYKPFIWEKLKSLFPIGIAIWFYLIVKDNFGNFNSLTLFLEIPLQSIAVFCVLPYLSSVKSGKGLHFRFFTFVSIISYSMYLLNATPVYYILQFDKLQFLMVKYNLNFLPFIVFLSVTFGGGYLQYRFIEKPFMDVRDCFAYSRKVFTRRTKKEQLIKAEI